MNERFLKEKKLDFVQIRHHETESWASSEPIYLPQGKLNSAKRKAHVNQLSQEAVRKHDF